MQNFTVHIHCLGSKHIHIFMLFPIFSAENLSEAAGARTKRSIAGLQRLIQSLPIQGGEEKRGELPQISDNLDEGPESELRQKRYFCRKYFIYNPVNGRCIPTLRVIYIFLIRFHSGLNRSDFLHLFRFVSLEGMTQDSRKGAVPFRTYYSTWNSRL